MNELQIFNNPEFGEIRTVEANGEPWLVGKDVATALGYSDPSSAVSKNVDLEDKTILLLEQDGSNYKSKTTLINESGLYSLVLSSKLPSAKRFRRWVTNEVLPSIRKHGLYAADELLNDPDLMIKAMEALKAERAKNHQLQEKVKQDAPLVLFANSVSASKNSILVGELAKLLKQNGVDTGQIRLFKKLRERGYLIRRKGSDYNMPTQRAMELGLFEIKETAVTHSDGHISVNKTPKVTGKGQVYFVNLFLAEKNPAPGEQDQGQDFSVTVS